MATYIGVDGGGTKTRLLVQRDEHPPQFFEYDQTIRFLENGYEVAASKFIEFLANIDGLDLNDVKSISIGLAGASLEAEQRRFEQAIKSLLAGFTSVHVQGDASLSLGAAFGDKPGVIVIAGTGSVAVGKTEDGQLVRVGGWGRLLGDEGSGHAIGLAALRHYVRAIDGRDEASKVMFAISKTLEGRFNTDTREVRTLIAKSEIITSEFATIVFDHHADPQANEIIQSAAEDLAELVRTCAQLIHYRGEVRGIGSVIGNPVMLDRINELVRSAGLKVSALEPMAPVEYALQLARAAA